jgi:GNAT superfamily N-acetyltransferase
MSDVVIRQAGPADAEVVHGFVCALAAYEREPEAVETTPDVLRRQLAASPAPFECLLATVDGTDVGMALFFPTYSTWRGRPGVHLEDLFVAPSHRRRGVGRALVAEVARLVRARGWGRLEWAVLEWNEPAIRFYERLGGAPLGEWRTWRLGDAALARLVGD